MYLYVNGTRQTSSSSRKTNSDDEVGIEMGGAKLGWCETRVVSL